MRTVWEIITRLWAQLSNLSTAIWLYSAVGGVIAYAAATYVTAPRWAIFLSILISVFIIPVSIIAFHTWKTYKQEIQALQQTKDNVIILRERQRWHDEFESNLRKLWQPNSHIYGEAIIRDIRRVDKYPDLDDDEPGFSPWFKEEIKGLYHRGIEVINSIISIKYDEVRQKWAHGKYGDGVSVNAILVGRIPFDFIKNVQWDGDEYDNIPHIYCEFSGENGGPFESMMIYLREGSGEHQYFRTIGLYNGLIGERE